MAVPVGYRMLLNFKAVNITTRLTNRNSDTARLFHGTAKYYTKGVLKKEDKLKGYVLSRYMQYVQNYERLLEKRFPSAMKVYRIFSLGIQDFYKDLKQYLSIRAKMRNMDRRKGLQGLSRQEIELFQKMPSDMWRIAPVLLLSAIPFGNYVIFPLALIKPRTLLCSHFWSIQQRSNFAVANMTDRIIHNRPVFRCLQAQLDQIKDESMREQWSHVLGLIGSGVHPTATDVISCKQLFTDGPYSLANLSHGHIKNLTLMHGLHRGFFRRKRLHRHAFLIREMDKAIIREGRVEVLSIDVLKNCCFIRGLNGTHLSTKDMKVWLNQWLEVSQAVDDASFSLLLHCPIFFGYNHPQNWVLIY